MLEDNGWQLSCFKGASSNRWELDTTKLERKLSKYVRVWIQTSDVTTDLRDACTVAWICWQEVITAVVMMKFVLELLKKKKSTYKCNSVRRKQPSNTILSKSNAHFSTR